MVKTPRVWAGTWGQALTSTSIFPVGVGEFLLQGSSAAAEPEPPDFTVGRKQPKRKKLICWFPLSVISSASLHVQPA